MTNARRVLVAAVLLLMGGALACMGGAQKPSVEIISPPSGSQMALGEEVSVEYRASDATAVVRVELEVGGAVVAAQNSPVPEGQPVMNGILTWAAHEAGSYTLIVRAYNKDRVASDPVGVSITVGEGEAVPGSTVTISLFIEGSTRTPDSSATVPPTGATATRPPSTPSPTSTHPAAAPTTTSTRPAPTATQPPPPPTATQGPVAAKIELINNSGEEVYFVHFASPFHNFGEDQLRSDTVYAGNNYVFNVYAGTYRLQAVAGDGFVLDDRSGVDVRDHYDWVVPQTRQFPPEPVSLTVYNGCLEEIGRLYIYQPTDPNKGPNQIAGSIPIGGSEVFSLQPGMWAITAENASGAHLDHMNARDFAAGDDVLWNACAVG